ncbi:outer membrane protein [Mesorhizobium sp. CA12]|uniref:outer membrane protein n=1 Tax=Mesorhizobium sp. CA12 TaxID=2876644 RepID=UPI001CCCE38B|nr:outer membrane protein [Mesorhizobium sp. CA12]MBZ9860701.1 porin family protein [Mesorhizobium sp. CA12]
MKRLLLSSTFLVGFAHTSFAADVFAPQDTAVYNWSGIYVGADAGYGWGNSTQDFDGIDYNVPLDPKGWLGGLYAGYNYQLSNGVVLGVEGDFNFSDIDSKGVRGISAGVDDPTFSYGSDLKWTGSLRGRLGYAAGQFLPFVTGGLAVGRYENFQTAAGVPYSHTNTFTGWTLGAGVDYAMTEHIVLRVEYRYTDFGDKHIVDPVWTDWNVDLSTNDVRIGIAYKF